MIEKVIVATVVPLLVVSSIAFVKSRGLVDRVRPTNKSLGLFLHYNSWMMGMVTLISVLEVLVVLTDRGGFVVYALVLFINANLIAFCLYYVLRGDLSMMAGLILYDRIGSVMEIENNYGIYEFDVNSGSLSWSRGVYSVFEVDGANRPTLDMVLGATYKKDRQIVGQFVDDLKSGNVPPDGIKVEYRMVSKRGTKYLSHQAYPLVAAGGRMRVYGMISDITDTVMRVNEARKASVTKKHAAAIRDITSLNDRMINMNI